MNIQSSYDCEYIYVQNQSNILNTKHRRIVVLNI